MAAAERPTLHVLTCRRLVLTRPALAILLRPAEYLAYECGMHVLVILTGWGAAAFSVGV